TTKPLNLRIVLDKARDKLLRHFQINANLYKDRSDELAALVHRTLSASNPSPAVQLSTRGHLDLIFMPSSIRRYGNSDAHHVDKAYLAEAILTMVMSPDDRDKMIDIFTYTFDASPTEAASNAS
ncbi:hypothetical protein C0991_007207, partial [Blastosporella zonata]